MIQLLNRLPGSLNVRLALSFIFLALVPGLILLLVTFLWINGETFTTAQDFLVETARRREAVIRSEFDAAFTALDEFTSQPVTYQLLYNALVFRSTTSATGATNRLSSLLNTPGQERFESAWLMNREGLAIATSAQQDKLLPFNNTDRSTSVTYAEAEHMAEEGQLYKVVIETNTETDDKIGVSVITVIRDTGRRPIGYLVVQMNVQTLFQRHFIGESNGIEVDGYIIPPTGGTAISSFANPVEDTYISSSPPVLRALTGAPPTLDSYTIEEEGETEDVIGYAQQIVVADTAFVLLTEIHVVDILQQSRLYVQVAAFPMVVGGMVLSGVLFLLFRQLIGAPLAELGTALRAMGRGILDTPLKSAARQDEFGEVARLFVDVRQQTAQNAQVLTHRLRDRERDVRVTQSIIQALVGERDLQSLMNRVVALIVENFPTIYHAQIFLTDTENYAVLRASTGEVGEQLMSRGHRLAVGSVSVIGQAVQQRQVIVARDTSSSELHRRNEFLPDTRAELAIPLLIKQEVIGALDVQSKERDAFTEEMIGVMQALAAQISIALENVRLYEESQRQRSQSYMAQRTDAGREWMSYLQTHRQRRLSEQAGNETGYDFTDLRAEALAKGSSTVGPVTARGTVPFVVLIKLRGQALGALEFELPQTDFHYDKVLLAEELSNRLAISLDNARLFQESRKAAERERTVNTISAHLTSRTDVNEILRMAIQEVGQALRSSQVSIQLHRPTATDEPAAASGAEESPLPASNGSASHTPIKETTAE